MLTVGKSWGFYGRSVEVAEVGRILDSGRWFFCAISGRRRIGKTRLIQEALRRRPGRKHFYFQVPDSDERGVLQAFQDAAEDYGYDLPTTQKLIRSLPVMANAIERMMTDGDVVIADEFQYFHRQALSRFPSLLQQTVDSLRDSKTGGLFVLGSIHTEMTALLEDRASPLFNRITHRIEIGHWDFETLFEMFAAHDIEDPGQQLFLWTLFEGVPKFYRDAFEQGVLAPGASHRRETLRKLFFEGSSPLRDEADNWFLRELRGRYDSVLKLLARLRSCSHKELTAEYERAGEGARQLGGYLQTLIEKYRMVERLQPVFAGGKSRKARYAITDNFLSAWLFALGRNLQMARVQPLDGPLGRADDAMKIQEGFAFEKMTRQLVEECSRKGVGDSHLTDLVRGYWNKPDGSDIELDLVAVNDDDRIIRIGSCKRDHEAHDTRALARFNLHIDRFLATKEGRRFADWKLEKALFAPRFDPQKRRGLEADGFICRDLIDYRRWLQNKGTPP